MNASSPQSRTRYLTLVEAAGYLNVTERFMRRAVSERKVRYYKVGKLLRFDAVDLDALAREQGVDGADQVVDRVWLASQRVS